MLVEYTTQKKSVIVGIDVASSVSLTKEGLKIPLDNKEATTIKWKDLKGLKLSDIEGAVSVYTLDDAQTASWVKNNSDVIAFRIKNKFLRWVLSIFFKSCHV